MDHDANPALIHHEWERVTFRNATAAAVLESAVDVIVTIDTSGTIHTVNAAVEGLFGYEPQELVGQNVAMLMPEPHRSKHDNHVQRYLTTGEAHIIGIGREVPAVHADGTTFPVHLAVSTFSLGDNTYFTGIIRDTTELRSREADLLEANRKLTHLASHDMLTGLLNRYELYARAQDALQRLNRHDRNGAMLFIDVDRFKSLNDVYGHAAGDLVLTHIAKRINANLRSGGIAARIGGDEFAILLEEISSPQDAELVADRFLTNIAEPIGIGSKSYTPAVSIGIASFPDDAITLDQLMAKSDQAMYRAKQAGGNQFRH